MHEKRFEKKIPIRTYSSAEIIHHVSLNPALFSPSFPDRRVNNIYFDTLGYNDLVDNIDGHSKRRKVRLRWYGGEDQFNIQATLEFKIKTGELGYKESFALKNLQSSLRDLPSLTAELLANNDIPEHIKAEIAEMSPALMNRYQRKYYESYDKKIRLTLDTELEYWTICENFGFTNQSRSENLRVIEIKYSEKNESAAARAIGALPYRVDKNSKYVTGMLACYFAEA